MSKFTSSLKKFSESLNRVISKKTDLKTAKKVDYLTFTDKKQSYEQNMFFSSFNELISSAKELEKIRNENNEDIIIKIKQRLSKLKQNFEINNLNNLINLTSELLDLDSQLSYPVENLALSFKLPKLAKEIEADMSADAIELEKCFTSGAFRASVILCGRLLETALHRRFYEATKQDILEKSPGIGLGNLIARMKEQNIPLDPAVAQQIHLINQVRIYSVHTKKEAFYPTKDQTHAIILYTLDIIRKLFSSPV